MTTPPSSDNRPLDDAERLRLVAYLDGELPPEESRRIEARLAADASTRVEVQRLDRVWNALDALPRPSVDESFTESTVEMIAVEAEQEVERLTTALPVQRRRRGYRIVAICAAALLLGAAVARTIATRNDRQVLANLPVIYQVDALGQFRDPAYLRELRREAGELLTEFEDDGVRRQAAAWRTISEGTLLERAVWVAQQPDDEKLRLQQAARRFAAGAPRSRESARERHAAMLAEPDADELLATAVAYQAWLSTQTPADQSRLRQIDSDAERVAEARRLFRRSHWRAERTLSDEDSRALREAIKGLAGSPELERIKQMWLNRLRPAPDREGEWLRNAVAERRLAEQRKRITRNFDTFPAGPIRLLTALAAADPPRLPPPVREALDGWPEIERRLVEALSEPARQTLADARDDRRRLEQLGRWIEEAARDAVRPDSDTIEAFFASDALTDDDRHNLLALPTEEMKRRLRRKYSEVELGGAQLDLNLLRQINGAAGLRGPGGRGPRPRDPSGRGPRPPRRPGPNGG